MIRVDAWLNLSNIVVGVGAVILIGGKILLIRRANSPYKGYWSIPGGRVEYGESIAKAVVRELREETGIEAKPICIIYVTEILPNTCSDCFEHIVIIDFLMEPLSTDVKALSDATDAKLFDLNDLPWELTKHTRALLNILINVEDPQSLCATRCSSDV